MLAGLFASIGQALIKLAAFAFERWRVFLPLAIAVAVLLYIFHLQNERDDAVQGLASLSQYIAEQNEKHRQENLQKKNAAEMAIAGVMSGHSTTIATIKAVEDEKLKQEQARGNNTEKRLTGDINLWRERVRLELAQNLGRPSADQTTAKEPTSCRPDSDPAFVRLDQYTTLELACKITTADYNALWLAWEKNCEVYGCEP